MIQSIKEPEDQTSWDVVTYWRTRGKESENKQKKEEYKAAGTTAIKM